MTLRFTARALADVEHCLAWSAFHFGQAAAKRYRKLIAVAVEELAAEPARPGSKVYDELQTGMRIYHLTHSRKRAVVDGIIVKHPRHFLVYRTVEDGALEIVRLLHERMDVERHMDDPP